MRQLLWRGITFYAQAGGARYLIGCSSIHGTEPRTGARRYSDLMRTCLAPLEWRTQPLASQACPLDELANDAVPAPKLLAAYLALGARICGPPPPEVSGTAISVTAMARGIRHGWLDAVTHQPVVVKGWEALETQIEADGTVHGICVGTMCSEDVEHYVRRPFYDNDTHGLFAVLFAGIVMAQLK